MYEILYIIQWRNKKRVMEPIEKLRAKKQVGPKEEVLDTGFVINFVKESSEQVENDETEDFGGVQVLDVEV
ncbi:MAG: hypothetical protein GF370_02810 [Candidatus Nealsonbacteria bacterium]|nr:hypothetical protein [Candidatus Nealsonbacteria bacterium]